MEEKKSSHWITTDELKEYHQFAIDQEGYRGSFNDYVTRYKHNMELLGHRVIIIMT